MIEIDCLVMMCSLSLFAFKFAIFSCKSGVGLMKIRIFSCDQEWNHNSDANLIIAQMMFGAFHDRKKLIPSKSIEGTHFR